MIFRSVGRAFALAAVLVAVAGTARTMDAQQSVTRTAAIARAIANGPRVAVARADSAFARAQVSIARQYENPVFSLGYSKDLPQHHVGLDLPIDLPYFRTPRIDVARVGLDAAALRYAFERQATAFDADTAYTQALAAAARAQLSRATAHDADSLLTIARVRRDAGDGTELDVQLAMLSAGQLTNAATNDLTDAVTALLAVQALMGLPATAPSIALADTLDAPPSSAQGGGGTPLLIAAAEADAHAADLAVSLERRRRWGVPSLSFGFDTHDPGGQGNQILPTIGIALPLPLFNQNSAAVQMAQAERDRAMAMLSLTRIEVNAELARARRDANVALVRVARSRQLVDAANSVAALSLVVYAEGGATLASVLEAQRAARETVAQYVDDVAAARNAASLAQLLELNAATVANANRNPR